MKRVFSDDWISTGSGIVDSFKDVMDSNIDIQDDPYLGIFWYDINSCELFGVKSCLADDVPFYKSNLFDEKIRTCRPLHYKVWEKEHHRGRDRRFQGDYTRVPRGRVFQLESGKFIVMVGSWIDDNPEAKELIIDEFQLPEDSTEFQIDIHWELGHGWSDKFM